VACQRLLTGHLESDVALKTKYTFVPSPPRLAIDIEGLDLNPSIKEWVGKIKPDDPNITGVRVAQNSPGVVRMVFDLKQAVQPQVFALTPVGTYQHRLVLDLYPSTPVDPLESWIAERTQSGDALSDWLNKNSNAGSANPPPPPLKAGKPLPLANLRCKSRPSPTD